MEDTLNFSKRNIKVVKRRTFDRHFTDRVEAPSTSLDRRISVAARQLSRCLRLSCPFYTPGGSIVVRVQVLTSFGAASHKDKEGKGAERHQNGEP